MPHKFWSKVKFYLGLECIAKYGEEFVVTKRSAFGRVCLDRKTEFWWTQGYWNRYCTLPTLEKAEARIVELNPEPVQLPKLEPLT